MALQSDSFADELVLRELSCTHSLLWIDFQTQSDEALQIVRVLDRNPFVYTTDDSLLE